MFCRKCGSQLDDSAQFCPNCGERVAQPGPGAPGGVNGQTPYGAPGGMNGQPYYGAPYGGGAVPAKKSLSRNQIIIIAAVAAVAVIALIAFFLLRGRGYKTYRDALDAYVAANFEGDYQTMMKVVPEDMLKVMLREKDLTEEKLIEQMREYMGEYIDALNSYDRRWRYFYRITDVESVLDGSQDGYNVLKGLNDRYKSEFGVSLNMTNVVEVDIEFSITANGKTETGDCDSLYFVEIGGSWYCDLDSWDSLSGDIYSLVL